MLVVETCAPKMGVGTWAIEGTVGSAAMTSMVEVLGTRVVDTTARSVGIEMPDVVEVAVEKDERRVVFKFPVFSPFHADHLGSQNGKACFAEDDDSSGIGYRIGYGGRDIY